MSELKQLAEIDWWLVFISVVLLLVGIKFVWSLVDWFLFDKLKIETGKMKQLREDREMLIATAELAKTTAENLDKLQSRHIKDEEDFRNNLNNYMQESRADRKALHDEMSKFTEDRINDRAQSLKIQQELTDSIKDLAIGKKNRDVQINALVCGSKELLGDTIDQRYNKYIELGGIPENEVGEFDDIYDAYKGLGGNHGRDAKYKYVKENLPIIPVEVVLKK